MISHGIFVESSIYDGGKMMISQKGAYSSTLIIIREEEE
jgi:hypothetical protein